MSDKTFVYIGDKKFDLLAPHWSAVDLEGLAELLSGIYRFNGSLAAAWKQMEAKGVKRIQSSDIVTA